MKKQDTMRQNFFLSFGFLSIFIVLYFTTAILNTPTFQSTSGWLMLGIPLGVWLGFMIFPFSLALCWLYLQVGR